MLDDMLSRLLLDFNRQVWIEGDRVRVTLLRSNFEIWLERPDPTTATEIKAREGEAYAIPVRLRLVNGKSGKDVRGFDKGYLHPWWIRRFVFDIAAAVAYIEREWDVMSDAYVAKMEKGE
jgi:hypothetical protein